MIIAALLAFEVFNFSTTDFALRDMLGDLGTGAMRWSTILSLAFCGMDFAGIARLLTHPRNEEKEDQSGWFLLGAWVLAAAMNAALTWWGISVAIYNQPADSVLILDPLTFVTAVPVLVSVGVWLIRILIIGTLVYSFNPGIKRHSQTKARSSQKPFGFNGASQPIPSGYKPLNTHARMQNDRF